MTRNPVYGWASTSIAITIDRDFSLLTGLNDSEGFRAFEWSKLIAQELQKFFDSNNLSINVEPRGKGFLNFFSSTQKSIQTTDLDSLEYTLKSSMGSKKYPSTLNLQIVGTVRSCFQGKFAAPRQPSLVPSSRAVFTLSPSVPQEILKGLDEFSHVWIIFLFHLAAPADQRPTTQESQEQLKMQDEELKLVRFPIVRPPKGQGIKLGTFSTRAPHRPSPIGLSVAKIEKVLKRQIILSGMDLVDGTPILDIKPYHSLDCQPFGEALINCADEAISILSDVVKSNDKSAFNKLSLVARRGGIKIASWVAPPALTLKVVVSVLTLKEMEYELIRSVFDDLRQIINSKKKKTITIEKMKISSLLTDFEKQIILNPHFKVDSEVILKLLSDGTSQRFFDGLEDTDCCDPEFCVKAISSRWDYFASRWRNFVVSLSEESDENSSVFAACPGFITFQQPSLFVGTACEMIGADPRSLQLTRQEHGTAITMDLDGWEILSRFPATHEDQTAKLLKLQKARSQFI